MRIRTVLSTGLLVLGLSLAGCGGGNGDEPAAQPSTTSTESKAVKYSECMRQNGVPSFPDPDANGRILLQAGPGSDLNPESAAFKQAQEKCKEFAPEGAGQQGSAQQQADMLKYVRCMRQNGVPNMPDPQPDGKMIIGQGSGADPSSQAFKDAQETCRDQLPGGAAGS
ncbi:hypothetical protein ACQPZX_48640 [Actinoplanes sp. CA-142083]|uniref:hypothetical protein n=1 Tax=Actinoplanes sp. CA-142083 TaxID=3239903 RepID=UPI003D93B51A